MRQSFQRLVAALRGANRLVLATYLAGALVLVVFVAWAWTPAGHSLTAAFGFAGAGTVLVYGLHRTGLRPPMIALIVAAAALYLAYLSYTSLHLRNYDSGSHMAYIRYVVEHHARPPVDHCSICNHPPLYYYLAAVVFALCKSTGIASATFGLQLLSLLLFIGFVTFAAHTIALLTGKSMERHLALALVVLWPYSVINSIRINNDTLLYTLAAACLFFMARWHKRPRPRAMFLACLAAMAAVGTKANGHILVAFIVVVVGYHLLVSRQRRELLRSVAPPVAVLAAVVAMSALLGSSEAGGVARNVLGGAYKTEAAELKQRELTYYASFHLRHFVRSPHAETDHFRTVEPSYWNHLTKSSLLGTRNRGVRTIRKQFVPSARVAAPLTYLLLALTALLALGVFAFEERDARRSAFSLLAAAVFVSCGLAFHLLVPTAHHNDFRFIFPVVIAMSLLYAFAAEALARYKLRPLAYAVAVAFMLVSVAHFVPSPSFTSMFEPAAEQPRAPTVRPGRLRRP